MLSNILIYSGFAGFTIFLGGLLAKVFDRKIPEGSFKIGSTHMLMSFGSGIILSALALVLVPQGMKELNVIPLILTFFTGTISFFFLDKYLSKSGSQTATLLAMLTDCFPEAIALGAVFMSDVKTATLLAIIIGLQNLPESFNAYRDLTQSGWTAKKTLSIFFFLSFTGILGALIGYFFLSHSPQITAYLMIFSSGGILFLLIQDIIPDSKLSTSAIPSLGASLGFLLGMVGEKLI